MNGIQMPLNMNTNEYGALFRFIDEDTKKAGFSQLSFFQKDSDYFDPSKKQVMLNLRVRDLEEYLEKLKSKGVQVLDKIETFEYGKFVHILDPEGNKIELWEPIDKSFDDMYPDNQVNK